MDDVRELVYSGCRDDLNELQNAWQITHSNNISIIRSNAITFDPDFILWGFEDIEWGYRLIRNGLRFKLCRDAVCFHQYHDTEYAGSDSKMKAAKYSTGIFYKKHLDFEISSFYTNANIIYDIKTLKLGNVCNNNCKFCNYLERKGDWNKSTREVISELEEIAKNMYDSLYITGGEPTLREDIFELLSYAQSIGLCNIYMKTNGRMLSYKDYAERMSDFCNAFQIHLFGHTAETHDSITGVPGSFEQTLQGIRNLTELDKRVFVNVIINRMNYKFLKETVDLLIDLGVSEVIFTVADMTFKTEKKEFLVLRDFIPRYSDVASKLDNVNEYVLRDDVRKRIRCSGVINNEKRMHEAHQSSFMTGRNSNGRIQRISRR
ncbi:MAG: radical SAM protein [Candidatus Aenigmatarchaeota archaeon]